ncbi:hypothetical protein TI10_08205, partial [Photorhabdus luminescens subsp. luminescens]
MANRKPRKGSLLTVDDVYRQPVGPAHDPKSLYALLLRFVAVAAGAELVGDDIESADPSYLPLISCGPPNGACTLPLISRGQYWNVTSATCTSTARPTG